ncbi:MAG: helix-turn-helix transcriptional regulator [Gemmatimonadota bacterium]
MPETISKTQRWLDLIAFLIGHRFPVSVDQIMESIPSYTADHNSEDPTRRASVRRKFERDKDELKDMGIPIKTVLYSINYGSEMQKGYRLARKDFYLPYLNLVGAAPSPGSKPPRPKQDGAGTLRVEADELGTALSALRRVSVLPSFPFVSEARSAFRKLSGDLDPDALEGRVLYVDGPDAEEGRARLQDLARALQKRKTVRFSYHGMYRGETTEREVHPFGLFFQGGSWYLVGYDLGREGNRVFRVSRMEGQEVEATSPHTPDYEVPDDFDLTSHVGREPWELGSEEEDPVVARVRFAFPRSLWAERNGHGRLVETDDDGSAVREFEVRQVNPFCRWILTFEGDAQVEEPQQVKDVVISLAEKIRDMHQRAADE